MENDGPFSRSKQREENILQHTADIAMAFVGNNTVAISDLPSVIATINGALKVAAGDVAPAMEKILEPAVPVRLSVKKDYIVCLDDGKRLKMLKRHIMTHYGMTPDDYRTKWGLPSDYPMVAPAYAEQRRVLAKAIGLGHHPESGRRKVMA